jgi:lysyl-tRNA synthetase class 2
VSPSVGRVTAGSTAPTAAAPPRDRRPNRTATHPWVPRVAGLLCALVGLINLASALSHADRSRLHALTMIVPGALTNASAAGTLVTGILLLLLARALRRRKRRAWRAVVLLLIGSVGLHVLKGLDVEEAAAAAALLIALIVWRDEFTAKGDPRTRWRAVAALAGLLLASVALGLVLIGLRHGELTKPFRVGPALEHVAMGMVGVEGPLRWEPDAAGRRADDIVSDTLLALGLLTAVTTAYLVLRPAEPQAFLSADDELRMRELLARHGTRDSLGYFGLRRDKSVLWSPTGKACIAYRVLSGVMLASGDPLGDPEAWPGAINAFLDMAAEHAWVPAAMGCSELAGTAWARAGLSALEIGDEAVVEVDQFSLEGRAMRNVRQATARVERAGYTCEVRRVSDIPPTEGAALRRQAEAWRGAETERGFSMALGRLGDPADPDCVVVLARHDDSLKAFLHFVPWGKDGLSLDLMRRDRHADNGVNELLIVRALEAAPALGVRRLSLNFAVFRSSLERGERLGAGPFLKAWRALLIFASRWFQIESLYRFNAKFRPVWEPRFVCYPTARDLPRVAIAALEAEAFLVWPRFPRLIRRDHRPTAVG